MSGPHQPGWSDDELIALGDLRPGRNAFPLPQPKTARPQPAQPKARSQKPAPRTAAQGDNKRPASRQTSQRSSSVPSRSSHTGGNPQRTARPANNGASSRPRTQLREPQQSRSLLSVGDLNLRQLLHDHLPQHGDHSDTKTAELHEAIRYPLRAATLGVFSRKGGVGKTTITAYLGMTLATIRRTPVVAVDGDADAGSLGWLLAPRAPSMLGALTSAPAAMS